MAIKPSTLSWLKNEISLILTGLLMFLIVCAFLILSTPCYLYRFIISKIVAPLYFGGSEKGKLISIPSNALSLDSLETKRSPRGNLLVTSVIDGHVSYQDLYQKAQEKWINQRDQNGHLKYPEFQMFMEKWMGYMCFKRDENFHLGNHLKQITLDKNGSNLDSEMFYLEFIENLINKNWKQKQSPWKVYLVHNYKNTSLGTENRNLTLIVYCFHHSLTDGIGILYLCTEQLFGNKLDPIIAKPSAKRRNYFNLVKFPIEALKVFGQIIFWKRKDKSIYFVPDNRKSWWQLYRKSPLIPISKVKFIKNNFGVSFASVINSACSLALSKMMGKLEMKRGMHQSKLPEHILAAFPLPRKNHPKNLSNHILGVAFELPITTQINSIARLKECDERAKKAAMSPMPMLLDLVLTMYDAHPASLANSLLWRLGAETVITNFPGPEAQITWNGGPKVIAGNCEVGVCPGKIGVGFMVCCYVENIQICATAEKAIVNHDELQELLDFVCFEINHLYNLATGIEKIE